MQQESSIPAVPPSSNEPIIVTGDNKSNKSRGLWSILSLVSIFPLALIAALLMTTFVFQSYEVDGPSMETTLQNTDRLMVWKIPRTWARITRHAYVPQRGEVVIFVKHDLFDGESGKEKQLIKRVVGVPGDRVVVQDGHITIYNSEYPDGFNPDVGQSFSGGIADFTRSNVDVVVGKDELFVCGDNRPDSYDSRYFGTIKSDDLVGRLIFRIMPINKFESFI